MNRLMKTLLIICSLILIVLFGALAVLFWPWSDPASPLPAVRRFLYDPNIQQTIFWISAFLLLAALIAIIVIAVFPKQTGTFTLKEKRGKLSIHKKAIEGFVRESLREKEFVGTPKVLVHSSNNQINVKVRGELKRTSSLIGKTEQWAASVQEQLQQLLGEKNRVKVNVDFEYWEKSAEKSPARVV